MLLKVLLVCLVLTAWAPLAAKPGAYAADPSNYEMIEAPTAYTLLHGGYDLNLRMYESGGLFLRANVGFKRWFQFGLSGNATNVIGQGPIRVQEPRLAIKFKPLSQGRFPFTLAAGWDDRGYGVSTDRRFSPGLQKGLYLVGSREFAKLGFLQVHAGVNLVKVTHPDMNRDLGLFGGVSFAVTHAFLLNLETDKLLDSFWQFNSGFLIGIGGSFRVGMDFRDMNHKDSFTRILRLQYLGFF